MRNKKPVEAHFVEESGRIWIVSPNGGVRVPWDSIMQYAAALSEVRALKASRARLRRKMKWVAESVIPRNTARWVLAADAKAFRRK